MAQGSENFETEQVQDWGGIREKPTESLFVEDSDEEVNNLMEDRSNRIKEIKRSGEEKYQNEKSTLIENTKNGDLSLEDAENKLVTIRANQIQEKISLWQEIRNIPPESTKNINEFMESLQMYVGMEDKTKFFTRLWGKDAVSVVDGIQQTVKSISNDLKTIIKTFSSSEGQLSEDVVKNTIDQYCGTQQNDVYTSIKSVDELTEYIEKNLSTDFVVKVFAREMVVNDLAKDKLLNVSPENAVSDEVDDQKKDKNALRVSTTVESLRALGREFLKKHSAASAVLDEANVNEWIALFFDTHSIGNGYSDRYDWEATDVDKENQTLSVLDQVFRDPEDADLFMNSLLEEDDAFSLDDIDEKTKDFFSIPNQLNKAEVLEEKKKQVLRSIEKVAEKTTLWGVPQTFQEITLSDKVITLITEYVESRMEEKNSVNNPQEASKSSQ